MYDGYFINWKDWEDGLLRFRFRFNIFIHRKITINPKYNVDVIRKKYLKQNCWLDKRIVGRTTLRLRPSRYLKVE